jgi:hypothetical protein
MELAKCPECGATVSGMDHQAVKDGASADSRDV